MNNRKHDDLVAILMHFVNDQIRRDDQFTRSFIATRPPHVGKRGRRQATNPFAYPPDDVDRRSRLSFSIHA